MAKLISYCEQDEVEEVMEVLDLPGINVNIRGDTKTMYNKILIADINLCEFCISFQTVPSAQLFTSQPSQET